MECKWIKWERIPDVCIHINRDILECKSKNDSRKNCRVRILIETYWNVNDNGTENFTAVQNILIETYWNVNIDAVISLICTKLY